MFASALCRVLFLGIMMKKTQKTTTLHPTNKTHSGKNAMLHEKHQTLVIMIVQVLVMFLDNDDEDETTGAATRTTTTTATRPGCCVFAIPLTA